MVSKNSYPKTYDVHYIVNGIHKETLAYNKPKAIANWIKENKETTTHTMGKISLVENKK